MLDIQVNTSRWTEHLDDVSANQIPFAMKTALNALGLEFQALEQHSITEEFTVRQELWLTRSVKITHFATKQEPSVTIGIHPPGGDDRADILGKFETDTEKRPMAGRQHLAIPTGAKRNKRDIVQNAYRPRNLQFHQVGKRTIGEKRTFIIKLPNGTGLILQRVGKGKNSTTRSLFLLVPVAPIKPDLHFERNAIALVERTWDLQFEKAFTQAMSTAK